MVAEQLAEDLAGHLDFQLLGKTSIFFSFMKKPFLKVVVCVSMLLSFCLCPEATQATWGEGLKEAEKHAQNAGLSQEKESDILIAVMDILTRVVIPLVVILIIISGLVYVFAGTKPDFVNLAQNILTYAIIGLVVVLLAFIILRFISDAIYSGGSSGGNYANVPASGGSGTSGSVNVNIGGSGSGWSVGGGVTIPIK